MERKRSSMHNILFTIMVRLLGVIPGVIGLSQSLAVCFFGSLVLLPLMLHASGKFSDGGLLEWRFGFRLRTCFVVIRPRNC